MSDNESGHRFWGALISFFFLLPMSIPRQVNTLRYFSAMGVICGVYVSVAIFFIFLFDRKLVPSPVQNLKDSQLFIFSANGVLSTVPLIFFAFLYQLNIPGIYGELRGKNLKRMNQVTMRATATSSILYIITGVFGYLVFVKDLEQLKTKNILDANFQGSAVMTIALVTQFLAILTSFPLILLPCKDTIEELFWNNNRLSITSLNDDQEVKTSPTIYRMSAKANLFITFVCVLIPYLLSLFLSSLGDALTIVGSTINPTSGIIIPILFYWKIYPDKSIFSREKLPSLLIGIVIIFISVLDVLHFFMFKKN